MKIEDEVLKKSRTVAVVGASPDAKRYSCKVAMYLQRNGYNVIPVNPNVGEILGKTSYANLSAIPEPVEVVNIFRRPEQVMPIVEEAIKIGAKTVWMQEGIVNEAAAAKAKQAGLLVVMDKCMRKEHMRLKLEEGNETSETIDA